MTLEELLRQSLLPIEFDREEMQRLSDSLQSLPARSIRRLTSLHATHHTYFETLESIAWHSNGYWWDESRGRPGAESMYAAGGYFIQDAASMLPLTLLNARPGEIICDLCAAPGGKSTAIAEALGNSGWLLANEAIQSRLAPLELNLARTGSDRYLTSNLDPEQLAQQLPQQFDALLVDAPCSGQTLIGKGKQSYSSMNSAAIELNAARQVRILDAASQLVRPGGRLVYSTCTLATAENEQQVLAFLERHPSWELVPLETLAPFQSSLLSGCYRLWPHRDRCAGGFAALLHRRPSGTEPLLRDDRNDATDTAEERNSRTKSRKRDENRSRYRAKSWDSELPAELEQWGKLDWATAATGQQQAFAWPEELPAGWLELLHGGPEVAYKKGTQWFPSHALALRRNWQAAHSVDLADDETKRFMAGETLDLSDRANTQTPPWCVARWQQLPLGWLKIVGKIGKNHIPKPARLHLQSS